MLKSPCCPVWRQCLHPFHAVDATCPNLVSPHAIAATRLEDNSPYTRAGEGTEREPGFWATVPSGCVGFQLTACGSSVECSKPTMGAAPTMTSFLVEDLDEVLELSD